MSYAKLADRAAPAALETVNILRRLRANQSSLEGLGVESLSLFGSAARGAATASSDIDLAVVLAKTASVSLLGFVGIERTLEELLGQQVDLVLEPAERLELQQAIDRDRVRAF